MNAIPETHQRGVLTVENLEAILPLDRTNVDVGIQVEPDGRIWLCVEGLAFARFRPHKKANQGPVSRMFWHPGRLRRSVEIIGDPCSAERVAMVPELELVIAENQDIKAAEKVELVLKYTNLPAPPQ